MYVIDKNSDKIITASVGIVHPKGQPEKYIIVKNKRGWDIPGGHLYPEESPQHAFIREVMEEANCKIFSLYEVAKISSDKHPNTAIAVFVAWAEVYDFTVTEEILERAIVDKPTLLNLYFGNKKLLNDILQEAE